MIGEVVAVKVREDWGIVPAVSGPHKAPAGLDAKPRQPHHSCYPLLIDDKSVTPKLLVHAPIAVAGQLILDVLDDGSQLGVCKPFGLLGGTTIVSPCAVGSWLCTPA
jgi:hypothetical protein